MSFTIEKYYRNKKTGGCAVCQGERFAGTLFCDFHREQRNRISKKWRKNNPQHSRNYMLKRRQKLKKEGKCIRCYNILDPDMDGDYVKCLNCRKRITGTTTL